MGPILEATRTVPIVFAIVPDPVGSGYVKSLSRPGGNATGFMMFEYSLCGKWPALLKEIAPHTTRAAVLRDAAVPAGIGQFAVIQSVAGSVGVEVIPVDLNDAANLAHELADFAQSANGGLILTVSPLSSVHRDLIITLAARHKLPAVYQERNYAEAGGLISYGPSFIDQYRRAAGYVDRILKGEKPSDLPVQAPTKYDLTVNLKTAKALGLEIPAAVLAPADEVIEWSAVCCTCERRLLARLGRPSTSAQCPLSRVDRTFIGLRWMAAIDLGCVKTVTQKKCRKYGSPSWAPSSPARSTIQPS